MNSADGAFFRMLETTVNALLAVNRDRSPVVFVSEREIEFRFIGIATTRVAVGRVR